MAHPRDDGATETGRVNAIELVVQAMILHHLSEQNTIGELLHFLRKEGNDD